MPPTNRDGGGGKVKHIINLNGPEGNAFALLGTARRTAYRMGKTQEQVEAILNDMTSDDYDNLVKVFNREFGDHFTLEGRRD